MSIRIYECANQRNDSQKFKLQSQIYLDNICGIYLRTRIWIKETWKLRKLMLILKDLMVNMKKKERKTFWNFSCKLMQEKYYSDYNIVINSFNSIVVGPDRNARNGIRKKIQADP